MKKWRGWHFFITLQFNHIYSVCVGGEGGGRGGEEGSFDYFSDLQSFEVAMQDSHPSLYCTKKPGIIYTFLIHSVSLEKMYFS